LSISSFYFWVSRIILQVNFLFWTDFSPRPGWILHIYNDSGQRVYQAYTYDFHDGWAGLTPANTGWREVYPEAPSHHVYSRFVLPVSTRGERHRFPVVWDLVEKADRFRRRFLSAVSRRSDNLLWAEVGLWELLLELAESCEHVLPADEGRLPRAVRQALRYVETVLCDPITAEDVAAEVDLSYSHLAMLFRKHVGYGVAAHVRRRRMAVTKELRCHSEMPIKSIAAQIGMTNLQHFNKLVRRAHGVSPRALRRHAMEG